MLSVILGYMGIMEKKMETTILCRVILGFMLSAFSRCRVFLHIRRRRPLCIIQKQPFDSIGPPSICVAILRALWPNSCFRALGCR